MTDPNRDYPEALSPRSSVHDDASAAPDAAALALRDMAQRLKRTEERSEKAFGAVGDNLRRILARLDEVERKLEAGGGAGAAGSGPSGAAQAAQIEALATRLEDMSDALAAASGDIESLRRRIEQHGAPEGAGAAASGVQAPPTAELMRALNARLEQTRAEAARAGGAAERAAREALAQAGESSRKTEEASVKLTRALAAVAARVEAFEKRAVAAPAAAAALGQTPAPPPPYEPGLEAPADYGQKDVAPYVARVERELAGGSNFFDRIAAAAEARVNVGGLARGKEPEGYAAQRPAFATEGAAAMAVAPQAASDHAPERRHERAPEHAYAAAPDPIAASSPRGRPAPEAAPEAAAAAQAAPDEEVYLGDLAVVPGRKARSGAGGGRTSNPKTEFDAAFAEEEEAPADVSVGDLRSRLRAKPSGEAAEEKSSRRRKAAKPEAPAAEAEGEAPAKKGGLLGFLKRGKSKDEELDEADHDEEEGGKAAKGRDKAASKADKAKSARGGAKRSRRSEDEDALAAFEAEIDDEEDGDWDEEVSRGRSKIWLVALGVLILAAAGYFGMTMRGA